MLSRFAANVGQSINNPNASLRCLTLACRQLHEIHYFEQYPPDHRTATRMALPDFSRITERYGPSVTNISVTGTTKVSNDSPLAQGGIDAVLQLPLNDRRELVYSAWKSLDVSVQGDPEYEVLESSEFAEEVERRLDEAANDPSILCDGDDVLREARQLVGQKSC